MKRILVPCDFSAPSTQAFRFACEIASASKGEIFLLKIVEFPTIQGSRLAPVEVYERSFIKELKTKSNKDFEKLKGKWGGKIKIHFSIEHGSVTDSIARFTAKKKIDLIIMGTHGSNGLMEFAVGSNTEKVVRSSKVPVIAVKKAVKISSIKDIIFTTNLDFEKKKFIASIKTLQAFFKAKLHILYVNTPVNFQPDFETEKCLTMFAQQHQFKNYSLNIYNDLHDEKGIANFSSQFKNKIIAMATHGRKGLSHLFNGSIAENMVNHMDCPIWTMVQQQE
jgi:nucleotide-binding universal stress UspA family protein